MNESETKLKLAIERLEISARKIVETRGYNHEVRSLKILEEIMREQLIHANTRPSTRTLR